MKIIHVASYSEEFFNGIKSVLIDLVPKQEQLGLEVFVLNHIYNARSVIPGEIYITSRKEFIKKIEEINPDIVIFHSLYGLRDVLFSWYLNKKHIPYLIEPHGGTSYENAKKSWLVKKVANFVYANRFISKAAGLVYLNKKESEECVFKHIRKNYAIVPNGTQMQSVKEKSNKEGVIRFVFLGRIDIIHKGLDLLFPAIKKINNDGYIGKVEFHFYGKAHNPRYAKEFNEYIANAGDNVYFHGPVINEDKEKAYRNADVFILTSRYEGMPMAVLEALSYGLPCLLTRQTNVADIIENGRCGWITELDVESIYKTICAVISNYKLSHDELTKNALNAVKPYDWCAIAALSIREYRRLINY